MWSRMWSRMETGATLAWMARTSLRGNRAAGRQPQEPATLRSGADARDESLCSLGERVPHCTTPGMSLPAMTARARVPRLGTI